jgi:hypothetical protein
MCKYQTIFILDEFSMKKINGRVSADPFCPCFTTHLCFEIVK